MKLAMVGNNDGPLALLQALQKEQVTPVCVGLQKSVSPELKAQYLHYVDENRFFTEFDEDALLTRLSPLSIDLLINCFCNFRFKHLLSRYEVLNVHLAPLPRYRGRHPMHWALINGEVEFGVSIHRMTPEIDAGELLWQRMVDVRAGTSVAMLRKQLMKMLTEGFGSFFRHYLNGQVTPLPNRDEDATYVARRFPEDSALTEWHCRDTIYRKVMALRSEAHPAFLCMGEQSVTILRAELSHRRYVGLASPFVSRILPDAIEVVCGDGKSVILQCNPRNYQFQLNQKIP